MNTEIDVVVIGAGVTGASVAYHVARAGAAVILVDAGQPGAGVTADSFAWVGSSGVRTGPAARLRAAATEEYRRVEAELPGLPVTWSGSLSWRAEGDAPEAGPGQTIVDSATVLTLEPNVRHPPPWAVWSPDDAAVDAVGVAARLVAGARFHGAQVHLDTAVTAIRRGGAGQVVGIDTAAGLISGTTVVLAAGVATAPLAAQLDVGVPVEASPCPLHRLRAPAGLVRTVVNTQDFDLRQVAADQLIAAADSARRTLAAVQSTFHGAGDVELLSTRLGERPMPADGEPIIGPVAEAPGLYVAVMHAAVTLAPVVGRLIAQELVDGSVESALAGCRLDRF